jgi:phosphohistidine swiveling domain-containing protein
MVGAHVGFEGVAYRAGSARTSPGPAVIVTPYLQPELVAEFPSTAGCVADVGGTLSHAAIVARELGYPVMVLPGSTETIRDGDWIAVAPDGAIQLRRPSKSREPSRP